MARLTGLLCLALELQAVHTVGLGLRVTSVSLSMKLESFARAVKSQYVMMKTSREHELTNLVLLSNDRCKVAPATELLRARRPVQASYDLGRISRQIMNPLRQPTLHASPVHSPILVRTPFITPHPHRQAWRSTSPKTTRQSVTRPAANQTDITAWSRTS